MLSQMLGVDQESLASAADFARGFLDRLAEHMDRSHLQDVRLQRSLDALAEVLKDLEKQLALEHELVARQLCAQSKAQTPKPPKSEKKVKK